MLDSTEGIPQGDPFRPALFSLAVDPIAKNVHSEFNIWYLDDATIAGTEETDLSDLRTLKTRFDEIGLKINDAKCVVLGLRSEGTCVSQYLLTGCYALCAALKVRYSVRCSVH